MKNSKYEFDYSTFLKFSTEWFSLKVDKKTQSLSRQSWFFTPFAKWPSFRSRVQDIVNFHFSSHSRKKLVQTSVYCGQLFFDVSAFLEGILKCYTEHYSNIGKKSFQKIFFALCRCLHKLLIIILVMSKNLGNKHILSRV